MELDVHTPRHIPLLLHIPRDDKIFLSDFSAKLDDRGRISDLTLDGVHVGKFIGRMHGS